MGGRTDDRGGIDDGDSTRRQARINSFFRSKDLEIEGRSEYPRAYQAESNDEESVPFTLEKSLQVGFRSSRFDALGRRSQIAFDHGSHEDLTGQETAKTEIGSILDGSGEWMGGHQVIEHDGYDDPYSLALLKCRGAGD